MQNSIKNIKTADDEKIRKGLKPNKLHHHYTTKHIRLDKIRCVLGKASYAKSLTVKILAPDRGLYFCLKLLWVGTGIYVPKLSWVSQGTL